MKSHIDLRPHEVRGVLEGRQTQIRRIMAVQPPDQRFELATLMSTTARREQRNMGKSHWVRTADDSMRIVEDHGKFFRCPLGVPGHRLWVRETWIDGWSYNGVRHFGYRADGIDLHPDRRPWKPSIHMPRIASRITLEVVSVRVERLNDISEADAKACGAPESQLVTMADGSPCYTERFRHQWVLDHGIDNPAAWERNPWVWALTFKRVHP